MANSGVTIVIAGQDNTAKVFEQIDAHLKRTEQRAQETQNALENLGQKGAKALGMIGIAISARAIVTELEQVVKSSLDFGTEIEKASQKTGLAIGTLSTLHYAANVTSSDFDAMSGAVAKLDKSIGAAADGDKKAGSFLSAIGLNAKQLVTQSDGAEVAFRKLATTIAATANPIERVRLATGLLGKAGAEQIDTLMKIGSNWDYYKQKATEAGVQLDGKTVESLARTNAQLRDMQQRVMGAGLAFTQGLAPGLSQLMTVISEGKGDRAQLIEWGHDLVRVLAAGAMAAYGLASGFELLNSVGDEEAKADAGRYNKKAEEMRDIMLGKAPAQADFGPAAGGSPTGGRGFTGTGDIGEADKIEAAKKARDAAMLKLAEQGESLRMQRARNASELALAQLESDHKEELISDADFYAQKLAIQTAAMNQQLDAAKAKQAEIDAAIKKLRGDEARQGSGSAKGIEDQTKIADLQARRLQIESEISKLQTDGAKAGIESAEAITEATRQRLALSDQLAARLEAQRGGSSDARVRQSDDAYAQERKKLVATFGADSGEVSTADQANANKRGQIVASGVEQSSQQTTGQISAERAGVAAAEARGLITVADAKRQNIELDQREARALQPVLEAYERLADETGDLTAKEKVVELTQKIEELNTPINEAAKNLREGFDGAFENLFDNLDKGVKGFESFAKSIEKTVSDAVYKKFVAPTVESATARLFPNASGASGSALHNAVTAGKPGFTPKSARGIGGILGGLIPGAAGIPGVGGGAAKTGGTNVTVTLLNESDQQLKIGDITKAGGSEMDKFEALIVKNFASGGVLKQLIG